MNEMVILWLVISAVALITELATLGLTSIWFVVSGLISSVLAYYEVSPIIQVICFIIITVLQLIVLRPIAKKYLCSSFEKTNVDSLIGKYAIVTEDIKEEEGKGRVLVDGLDWKAISKDKAFKGDKVIILGIKGASLEIGKIGGTIK